MCPLLNKYNDDEDPISGVVLHISESDDDEEQIIRGDELVMRIKYKKTIQNGETKLEVSVELMESAGLSAYRRRLGVDVVAVVDATASTACDQRRADLQKSAIKFLISKLSPLDRLSIVTFSTDAERMFRLTLMNSKNVILDDEELKKAIVDPTNIGKVVDNCIDHSADLNCETGNIAAGLRMALQVLSDRVHFQGRQPAIVLLSGSDATHAAGQVLLGDVPIYTFALGDDFPHQVLKEIALKSNGGTISVLHYDDTKSISNLNRAFALCLARHLKVVVRDLELTLTPVDAESTRIDVIEINPISNGDGGWFQPVDQSNVQGSMCVSLGHLYHLERCKLLIKLLIHPSVDCAVLAKVIQIALSFSPRGPTVKAKAAVVPKRIRRTIATAVADFEAQHEKSETIPEKGEQNSKQQDIDKQGKGAKDKAKGKANQ